MKLFTRHINILIAWSLQGCVLMTSCIKSNQIIEPSDEGMANIELYVNTQNEGFTNENGIVPVETNEDIKTLRIIISNVLEEQEIVERNIFCDYSEKIAEEIYGKSRSLTILGLQKGKKNFYVIANEASLGLDAKHFPIEGDDIAKSGNPVDREVFNPPSKAYFPCTSLDIKEKGIPITGLKTGVILEKGNNTPLNIPVTYAVSKMTFKVKNSSSSSTLNLKGIEFGRFFPNGTFLFSQVEKEVPSSITYSTYNNLYAVEVPPQGEISYFTGYFFETSSSLSMDDYTVRLDCEGLDLEEQKIMFKEEITRLVRNSQANIVATISRETGSLKLEVNISPWYDGGSGNISYGGEFNCIFARTSADVRVTESEEQAYATVYDDVERQITFSMNMTTPEGAIWTASLSNGSEFELYNDNHSADVVSGIGGAGPVEFRVRPKHVYNATFNRETELYIALIRLAGENRLEGELGEQVINPNNEHPGTKTRIKIRQVSRNQWEQLKNNLKK